MKSSLEIIKQIEMSKKKKKYNFDFFESPDEQDKPIVINEETWHKLLMNYPNIIEDGLTFQTHEEHVSNGFIDLHFVDKNNLIVEVKRVARPKAIFQIMKYGLDYPNARLMIAAEEFRDDFKKSLDILQRYINRSLLIELKELIKLD